MDLAKDKADLEKQLGECAVRMERLRGALEYNAILAKQEETPEAE